MALTVEFLLRYMSDAVVSLDHQGRITQANSRAETLLQREVTAVVGRTLAEVLPDFAGSATEAGVRQAAGGTIERRLEHFSPSRYSWYEIRAVPTGPGLALFIRDVTDRARQVRTDAVREAVRQIIMDAPVAISITRGRDHRYEIVNNVARRLIGNREVEGRTARTAFPEVDPALFDVLDQVYQSGEAVTLKDIEVAFDREGAGTLTRGTFDVTYQPMLESDGTVAGIISTSVETTDYVTERRRVEARATSAKDK